MMKAIWNWGPVRFVREVAQLYFSVHVSRSAAELAYFLVLSFFPVLICVNAALGTLRLDIAPVMDALAGLVPPEVAAILADYIRYITENQSAGMFLAGVLGALVSASAAVRALMNVMDDIYGHTGYSGILRVAVSLAFSLLLLVTVYLSLVVLLTGGRVFQRLERLFPLRVPLSDWRWLRFVLLFALVLLFILLLYRVSAPMGRPRPPVLTGAVLAAVTLAAASVLFSWFIGMSSRYSLVYGSLASVIILLVWLYLCGNILILGNLFNCVWYRHKKRRYRQENDRT